MVDWSIVREFSYKSRWEQEQILRDRYIVEEAMRSDLTSSAENIMDGYQGFGTLSDRLMEIRDHEATTEAVEEEMRKARYKRKRGGRTWNW